HAAALRAPPFPTRRSSDLLHGLLEWAGREGFAEVCANDAERRDLLARRCQLRGWPQWIEPLDGWLKDYLQASLPTGDGDLRLVRSEEHTSELQSRENLVCR